MKISAINMCKNIIKPILSSLAMCVVYLLISNILTSLIGEVISIIICGFTYLLMMKMLGKNEFNYIIKMINNKAIKNVKYVN